MAHAQVEAGPIWTPDRRLRVFVSSTLGELAPERAAVKKAVEQLRLSPVMFETGARPHPPRALYRSYLEQSDLFVGVYWQRYGWVAPDMTVSGLEDEFNLSEGMPRLVYVKRPATEMEPRLADLLRRLQAGDAESYKPFATAAELRELVLDDLALLLTERFGATVASPERTGAPTSAPRPTTRLVGRGRDVASVLDRLRAGDRLVTLTGVGGVGKTRLAIAVLEQVADDGPTNTAFVDLSPVTDPQEVLGAVAVATGSREEGREAVLDALVRRLSGQRWLVVLDNLEQVVTAGPDVARLLERCPGLQVVVTSRVLLRLRGEVEYAVAPLPVDGGAVEAPAVALFEERARAAKSGFAVDSSNAGAVEELCRRLDGLPLALELAAPQLRLFTPQQLLARLGSWLEGQTSAAAYADLPARQRTLRATVDWSWELLDEPAQRLFARLAIFNGPFTVEAGVDVCGWDGLDVLGSLATLLDHSLVSPTTTPDGQPAFRMLDTIRAQARSRLVASGEEDACFEALERRLVAVCQATSVRLHTAEQARAVLELDGHLADIAATVAWLLARSRMLAPLFDAIASCWVWGQIRGHFRRLPDISSRLDESGPDSDRDAAVLSWLHMGRLITSCAYDEVADFVDSRLSVLRGLDPPMYGMALVVLGLSTGTSEGASVAAAKSRLEEGVRVLHDSGYRAGLGYALSHLGDALLLERDLGAAAQAYGEALQIARDLGDVNLHAEAEYHLAVLSLEQADPHQASAHLRTAARYYVELVHLDGVGRCLPVAAGIELARGRPARAAELLGTAEALRAPLELVPWPMVGLVEARWSDRLREVLGEQQLTAARTKGGGRDGVAALVAVLGI